MQPAAPPWPWVMLGRVPRLVSGNAEAAAEQAEGAEVEAEQGAEVVVAAAAAEQAGEVEEAEPDEDSDGEDDADDFFIHVELPPLVTVVTVGAGAHPEPNHRDEYPYLVAVGNLDGGLGCLLFNFGVQPFFGSCFDDRPYQSNLIVAHYLDYDGVAEGHPITAAAERVPPRPGHLPIVCSIESIGLVTFNDGNIYTIAELMVDKGREGAKILLYDDGGGEWSELDPVYPLSGHDRDWVPAGVVCHESKFWWFDLSWGILSYDPLVNFNVEGPVVDDPPELRFHALPEGRILDVAPRGIHDHRCITETDNSNHLAFVEIICDRDGDDGGDGPQAATVSLWTRIHAPNNNHVTIGWRNEYAVSFEEIWDDDSYAATGLPRRVPVLVAVSPLDHDVVYFALERRLFGVNVPARFVEHSFVHNTYGLVKMPWPAPPSCRYVLPWMLPYDIAVAMGLDPFPEANANGGQQAAGIAAAPLQPAVIHHPLHAEPMVEDEEEFEWDKDDDEPESDVDDGEPVSEVPSAEEFDDGQLQPLGFNFNDDGLPSAEFSDDELRRLDNDVAVQMDPETLARLRADVDKFFSDLDHQGPQGQGPGDDAGKGGD